MADLPQCIETLASVHDVARYPIVWPDDPARWLTPSGLLGAWVAEQDRTVVGHIALVNEHDLPDEAAPSHGQPLALISRLYVTPSARRQATGAQLLGPRPDLGGQPDVHRWCRRAPSIR